MNKHQLISSMASKIEAQYSEAEILSAIPYEAPVTYDHLNYLWDLLYEKLDDLPFTLVATLSLLPASLLKHLLPVKGKTK